jgi:hypothetical protein
MLERYKSWPHILNNARSILKYIDEPHPTPVQDPVTKTSTPYIDFHDAATRRNVQLLQQVHSRSQKRKYECILYNIEIAAFMVSFCCDVSCLPAFLQRAHPYAFALPVEGIRL